jgi:hypothetical protein
MISVRNVAATAVIVATVVASSGGQSKLVQVDDPFPGVDCTVYDTGKYVTDKHSEACRSFVQLVKARDWTLPLLRGPVYACFGINDELFVIDTAIDQAKSDSKELAALATPRFAFYRSGIETGLTNLNPPAMMDGKWDPGLSAAGIASYSGQTSRLAEKLNLPHLKLSITETTIDFGDWVIQTSTGRFRYSTETDVPVVGRKPIEVTGQCAVFKKDFKMESPPNAKVQHTFGGKSTNDALGPFPFVAEMALATINNMANKQDLERLDSSQLAAYCKQFADSPSAEAAAVEQAWQLRQQWFSVVGQPPPIDPKLNDQRLADEKALAGRMADFLTAILFGY